MESRKSVVAVVADLVFTEKLGEKDKEKKNNGNVCGRLGEDPSTALVDEYFCQSSQDE